MGADIQSQDKLFGAMETVERSDLGTGRALTGLAQDSWDMKQSDLTKALIKSTSLSGSQQIL